MTVVKVENSEMTHLSYEAQDSVNVNATAGVSIILPAGINSCAVSVKVGAGATVKVQASTDTKYDIENDTAENTWIDWPLGEITSDNQDELAIGAVALRLYCVTAGAATSTIKVSAK